MYKQRKNQVSVKKIADFLKCDYTGKDFDVSSLSSLNDIKNNSVLFYSDIINFKFKIKDNVTYDLKKLEGFKNIVLITTDEIKKTINVPYFFWIVTTVWKIFSLILIISFSEIVLSDEKSLSRTA